MFRLILMLRYLANPVKSILNVCEISPLTYAACVTLLLQKPRIPQIQGVQGRSRRFLLRALGNEGDGASSAFPSGKKHDKIFVCFRCHQKFIQEISQKVLKHLVIIIFSIPCHVFYATAWYTSIPRTSVIPSAGVRYRRATLFLQERR